MAGGHSDQLRHLEAEPTGSAARVITSCTSVKQHSVSSVGCVGGTYEARSRYSDVVLAPRLRDAIPRLNPTLGHAEVEQVVRPK